MLTSLTVKVAISSEDVEEILVTSDQLGQEAISGRRQVIAAKRRTHALD
jgi:hypothetical protein